MNQQWIFDFLSENSQGCYNSLKKKAFAVKTSKAFLNYGDHLRLILRYYI